MQHHFPANDFFESMSLGAWLVTVAFLGIYWRYKAESLSVFVFPLVFVMTLVAALRNPVARWSSEAVRSTWLIVHIVLAVLGYAALLFTAVAAFAYLMQERQLKQKKKHSLYALLPPLGMLDELISRSLGAGFVLITISIIIGSVWSFIEYGTRWIDNGLITTSFITWGIYLALIFFRVSAGWRGRKAAILAIIALFCSAVTWIAHSQLESRPRSNEADVGRAESQDRSGAPARKARHSRSRAWRTHCIELQNLGASEAVILSTCNRAWRLRSPRWTTKSPA